MEWLQGLYPFSNLPPPLFIPFSLSHTMIGIASMNDLARLVLGDEGTSVKLRMQRSSKESTGAGLRGGSGGGDCGRGGEGKNRGTYEIHLVRSRAQTTHPPPVRSLSPADYAGATGSRQVYAQLRP